MQANGARNAELSDDSQLKKIKAQWIDSHKDDYPHGFIPTSERARLETEFNELNTQSSKELMKLAEQLASEEPKMENQAQQVAVIKQKLTKQEQLVWDNFQAYGDKKKIASILVEQGYSKPNEAGLANLFSRIRKKGYPLKFERGAGNGKPKPQTKAQTPRRRKKSTETARIDEKIQEVKAELLTLEDLVKRREQLSMDLQALERAKQLII